MDPFVAPEVSIVGSEKSLKNVRYHISGIITVHVYTIFAMLLLCRSLADENGKVRS